MTEQQWLDSSDPTPMLAFLRNRNGVSERKLRLFAVACCRRIWHLLPDESSQRAVEAAERFADGLVGERELTAAHAEARAVYGAIFPDRAEYLRPEAAARAAADPAFAPARDDYADFAAYVARVRQAAEAAAYAGAPALRAAYAADPEAINAAFGSAPQCEDVAYFEKRSAACDLLRDVFGPLPFRSLPSPDPSFLERNRRSVLRLAEAIYAEGRFHDLSVLADALEESGCTDEAILGHCRQQGLVHVRGCWLLDLVLGKK